MRWEIPAACVALFAGSIAAADIEVFIPDFEMVEHVSGDQTDDPLVTFDLNSLGAGNYTEMTVTFDYAEIVQDASWASDMVMQVAFANTTVDIRSDAFTGSGSALDAADADQLFIWDTDGAASGSDGTYSTTVALGPGGVIASDGLLSVSFSDVFNGNYNISNMSIALVGIPAPGALALLGLAGLSGTRRRRA